MDINNIAVQIMALKTKADMAGKQGNTQLRNDLLEQMHRLADQAMEDTNDSSRFVLMSTVYSMLVQAYFDSDLKKATNYAFDCLYKASDLAEYEDSEKAMTMLMGAIMSVLNCLLREFAETHDSKHIEIIYEIADMFKAVMDKIIALNPSGMAALRGQNTLQLLKQGNMLGKSNRTFQDIQRVVIDDLQARYYEDSGDDGFDKLLSDFINSYK